MHHRAAIMLLLMWSVGASRPQVQHWVTTPNETVWRGQYRNCDFGYAVDLPADVAAHASLPPNANHGFIISATDPPTTDKVSLENQRIFDIYAEYDALNLGSARGILNGSSSKLR